MGRSMGRLSRRLGQMGRNLSQSFIPELPLFRRRAEYFACAIKFACSLIAFINVGQTWAAKRITGGKIALAVVVQQLGIPAPFKADRIGNVPVDRVAVRIDQHQHKLRVAHAPLDFKRRYSTMNQFGNVFVHEHILDGKRIFGRIHVAVLLHPVVPAARLQALAPIAAHSKH